MASHHRTGLKSAYKALPSHTAECRNAKAKFVAAKAEIQALLDKREHMAFLPRAATDGGVSSKVAAVIDAVMADSKVALPPSWVGGVPAGSPSLMTVQKEAFAQVAQESE